MDKIIEKVLANIKSIIIEVLSFSSRKKKKKYSPIKLVSDQKRKKKKSIAHSSLSQAYREKNTIKQTIQ